MFNLSTIEIILYILYPVIVISISIFSSRNKEITVSGYFFANRNSSWWILGISFITTSMLGPYIFGLTGTNLGLLIVYGLISVIMLVILGYYVAPVYLKLRINTFPEFFEIRFNRTCRLFLAALYVLYNIFFRMSIILIAGSIFFDLITGYDAFTSLIYFLLITGLYVIIGGLQSEIRINVIHVLFLFIGAIALSGWLFSQNYAVNLVYEKFTSLSLFQQNHNLEFTPAGLLTGFSIIGLWFWCADQLMVQKTLSARNISHLRKAALFSIILQLIPILIFSLPAVISAVLFQGGNIENIPAKLLRENALPLSLRFIIICAAVSALMSSFASVFNSTSALITLDFYRTLKPVSSDRKLVLVGRLTTLFLLFCSILLIPTSQTLDFNSCLNLFKVGAYFASMVISVFLIGLLNKAMNAAYVMPTLITTTGIIILRIAAETVLSNQVFEDGLISWLAHSGFLEFSTFIFLVPVVSLFGITWIIQGHYKASAYLKRKKEVFFKLKYK